MILPKFFGENHEKEAPRQAVQESKLLKGEKTLIKQSQTLAYLTVD